MLYPSGAVYPQQAFRAGRRSRRRSLFTYAVHASCVLLKNTGFGAIAYDLTFLLVFGAVCMTAATALFKRTL